MNVYERKGIISDVMDGKHVVVCASRTYSSFMFGELVASFPEQPEKVVRSAGQQRIEHNGGSLSFAHSPDGLRGREADRVLMSVQVREQLGFLEQWLPNARVMTNQVEQISG